MIKEFIETRFFPEGRMRKQLVGAFKLRNQYPENVYAKTFFILILKKFLFGSNSVKYESLIQEAWEKIGIDTDNNEIIIDDFIFVNDNAFKSEFADIFLASDLEFDALKTIEQKVAREILKILSVEGAYESGKVRLQKGDIVIDAGANMGLFSIFTKYKDVAKVYAFEPQKESIEILNENIEKNKMSNDVQVVPFGLSDKNITCELHHSGDGHSSGSIVMHTDKSDCEEITCVTLDSWVKTNKIEKVDFIKADIEGAERDMLAGALETIRRFKPDLALCIYHLPDDPEVISSLIKKANPEYKIAKTSHKIYAYIPDKYRK